MQCTNNLKQIGLAIHNFHDTRNGLPPITNGSDSDDNNRYSLFALIYPYIEQAALYDLFLSLPASGGSVRTGMDGVVFKNATDGTLTWWGLFTPEQQKSLGSVNMYRCPTRRGSGEGLYTGTTSGQDVPGPLGDYAVPCLSDTYWFYHFNVKNVNDHITRQVGPLRVAATTNKTYSNGVTAPDFTSWLPHDTMAWWQDGSSNQFVIGEKHIPIGRLGQSRLGSSSVLANKAYTADCTYITTGRWACGAARNIKTISQRLANPRDFTEDNNQCVNTGSDPDVGRRGDYGFGSWHSGVCPFLLGDGSVQGISNTTAELILRAYVKVANDVQ
jgi:hypothetical protein